MLERWYAVLEEALELDFDVNSAMQTTRWKVVHRPGRQHANADAPTSTKHQA